MVCSDSQTNGRQSVYEWLEFHFIILAVEKRLKVQFGAKNATGARPSSPKEEGLISRQTGNTALTRYGVGGKRRKRCSVLYAITAYKQQMDVRKREGISIDRLSLLSQEKNPTFPMPCGMRCV